MLGWAGTGSAGCSGDAGTLHAGHRVLAGHAAARTQAALNPTNPITGLDAYLSLRADLRPAITHQTPLGPLTVTAVGTPTIRWGDGHVTTGPRGYAGAPYPDGKLVHQYIDRCVGTLVVTVAWTARWSLGGDSGSLSGLTTTAQLPLRTEEIQAVITPAGQPPPNLRPGAAPLGLPHHATPLIPFRIRGSSGGRGTR